MVSNIIEFIELDREDQQWNVFNRISEFEKFIIITEENLNFPIWALEILSKSTLPEKGNFCSIFVRIH